MKIQGKWGSKSVFRYIITFSVTVVAVFAVMGGYLYRYYYRTIYDNFLVANRREMEHILSRHEAELQVLESIVLQMSLESGMTHFLLDDAPEKSVKLKERLYQYKIANDFFDYIFYCYHRDHFLFNQTTSFELEFLLEKGLVLEEDQRKSFREYLYTEKAGLKILPEQEAAGYLQERYPAAGRTVIYFMPLLPYSEGTMAFAVNEFYYDSLMNSDADDMRNSYILYEDQVIVSRGSLGLAEDQVLQWVAGSGSGEKQVTYDSKRYLLTWERGASGICYCSVQAMDVFQGKVLSGQWGILLLLLLCSIPVSLLIVGISRTVSLQVQRWNVLLNPGEEDCYNLDSIESGIQLLTQNSQERTRESEIYRKSDFIRGFVRSDYKEEELREAAARAGFTLLGRRFLVALMGDRGNSNEKKAYSLMLEEIGQVDSVEGYGVRLVSSGQSLFVLFGSEDEKSGQLLQRMFSYGRKYCEDFIMAVSEWHDNLLDGAKAYLEADAAFDNRFLMDNSDILCFSDVNVTESIKMPSDTLLYKLRNAIRMGEEGEVRGAVWEICIQTKRENHSLLAFRMLYHDLVRLLFAEFQGEELNVRNLYNVFTLSQCLNIQDFNDVLFEICLLLMEGREGENERGGDSIAERASSYMQHNYHDPELNMGRLADYLGISPVTLAVGFKNSTGISPSDYLAGIRMEKAKELLEHTHMLVKEVALAVGYEDERVFMRRFKKYTGDTPVRYRMKRME